MQKLKIFKIIFTIAAILFLAKPFLGFEAFNQQAKLRISHTMLVKSFTKRKPESLQDAHAKAESVRQSIANPPLILLTSFVLFLATTLLLILNRALKLTKSAISGLRWSLFPPQPAYLLSGKLII